jgi:hypothetical protein
MKHFYEHLAGGEDAESSQHIYKMAKAGLIPCFHVRGAVRFCPAYLAEWIKQEIAESSRKRNGSIGGNGMKYGT